MTRYVGKAFLSLDIASWQTSSLIDRLCQLARIRPILGIPLITIQIQAIITRRRLDVRILFNSSHPLLPSAARLWVGPCAVRLQDFCKPDHPRGHLHINKRHVVTQEEGTVCVGSVDESGDVVREDLGVGGLLQCVLRLKVVVKRGDDVAVDVVGPET